MSRRGNAKPTGIQMFPFLAVLICTMGALVVLLHAFARNGQVQATKVAAAKARAQHQDEETDADFFTWRAGHLREAREKTQAQLAEERLKLSHVEDHQRRLEQKLEQLKIASAELDRTSSATADDKQRNAAELAETQARLAAAKEAVANARQSGKFKAVNYSVVPFEGRNATNRRPVYIECRENLIILQPEGIELTPRDFVGFFGPGNPLASALRAQREYFAQQAPGGKLPDEPYPLMLVRPDGIAAYYAARAALDSWGSDFGYELIGADWDLKFPERDPRLAELTERVVAEARERHREYVLNSSPVARRRSRPVYHAKSHGGFAQEPGTGDGPRGSGLGGWGSYSENSEEPLAGEGRGGGRRGTSPTGQFGDSPNGNSPGGLGDYALPGNTPATDPYAEPGGLYPMPQSGGPAGKSGTIKGNEFAQRQSDGAMSSGPSSDYYSGTDSQAGSGGRNGPGGPANGGKAHAGSASPLAASEQKGEVPAHNGSEGGNQELRNPNSPGGAGGTAAGQQQQASLPQSTYNNAPGSVASSNNGGAMDQQGMRSTPYDNSNLNGTPTNQSVSVHTKSLAHTRGQDWGLLGSGVGAVAASRPILVHCYPDRLVVVPESRSQPAKEIRLGERTQDSMDEFVSAVWDHMKVWGKAGRGLYWRPTLTMEVRPGAEARYAEIQALLANSGLDVDRRKPPATAQRPAVPSQRR